MSIQYFDCYSFLFPREEFPEMHIRDVKNEVEEVTKQLEKLDLMKVSQLKRECKEQGLRGYSRLKKNELIELIRKLNI